MLWVLVLVYQCRPCLARMKRLRNPIAFTPFPVTVLTSTIYAALFIALLVVHCIVPSAPADAPEVAEAWKDLQTLTATFHPYNSHSNDAVRDWILQRIEIILQKSQIASARVARDGVQPFRYINESSPVVVFSDIVSNSTFSTEGPISQSGTGHEPGVSVYFEGTNIIVYIRGSDDDPDDWWLTQKNPKSKGGVLVNAHYDSVSTGFGATDDGTGVVTILQLIKHFSQPKYRPRKGIVALFNNGEEDYLNGARAFTQHPMSRFVTSFLNLEGAGAGGRAALFRTTDTEVSRAYQDSKYPFGTVLAGDAFKRGVIRSQTDYIVFTEALGLRGLDVAFLEPRARYHTDQDDTRHTSHDSLWHMLSASKATVKSLSAGTLNEGQATNAVWFDLFGRTFAVFRLNTLFALSVALLVVAPLTLVIIGISLVKTNRFYLFSASMHHHHPEGDDNVPLSGWRGFFRYPVTMILASAAVVALSYLVTTVNPYIVYSSPYAVWSMLLSAWLFVAWFLFGAADYIRPSALQRAYALLWSFIIQWIILVIVTVSERGPKIASGYLFVFYFAGNSLGTAIAFLELFGLPRKTKYADELTDTSPHASTSVSRPGTSSNDNDRPGETAQDEPENEGEEAEATESTSLLPGGTKQKSYRQTSPEGDAAQKHHEHGLESGRAKRFYGNEQPWSWSLPTWTWLLQFLLTAPIPIVLFGQIALLYSSATSQTLADGNAPFMVYVAMALLSILILAPLAPFLHRYTYHIPVILLLVLIGTTIYNLVAFPFSTNNRVKFFFIQKVDLDTGLNEASLTGISRGGYLHSTVQSLPSATSQKPSCSSSDLREGLVQCSWTGLAPKVVKSPHPDIPPPFTYEDWISYNVTRTSLNGARFQVQGRDTRACKIEFHKPISDFHVIGSGPQDKRFRRVPDDGGSKEIRLWSRTWERMWEVDVEWEVIEGFDDDDLDYQREEKSEQRHERNEGSRSGSGMDGRIVCLWSDANELGVIPALDEIKHYAPEWVAVSKLSDGLVEGSKAFAI